MTPPIDIHRARSETPGCEQVLHFNNAGAALMPQPVLDAMIHHLHLEAQIGGYEAADRAREKIERVYRALAELIHCDPAEIAIIENATRAWDMAFYSLPLGPGDRILTAQSAYASNFIAFLQRARQTGAQIEAIPNDPQGQVSVEALKQMIDDRVKLIAITHVPTNGGLVNPAAAIGEVAQQAQIPYLLDACQSVGQIPIDVQAIGCDLLSATGRKFLRGPRGTGFLYVRQTLLPQLEPPFLDLHAARWIAADRYQIRPDARRFENWETHYAGKVGLGVAVDYALAWGLPSIWERVRLLADILRTQLELLPGVTVQDLGAVRCGIVSFTVADRDPAQIKQWLSQHQINVTLSDQASTRLDMEARHLSEVIRASVHYYNTEQEVDRFCQVLSTQV